MTAEETADRFDNRAGYKLIAYGIVGLPLYRLTTVGLCLAKKSLDPIEEFVLRSVLAGAECLEDVAGVLGLKASVVESCLASLLRAECVKVPSGAGATARRQVELTAKGEDLARGEEAIVPIEQTVVFCVDGLTRAPRFYPFERLYKPRDLRDLGIPEVRAFPARAPELDEIDIKDVIDVVRLDAGPAESPRQLLRINSIERRDRVFLDAVALAYRAESGEALQVAFAIDGRLSEEHETAFARVRGPQKTKLFSGLHEPGAPPAIAQVLGKDLYEQVQSAAHAQGISGEELRDQARVVRARIDEARLQAAQAHQPAAEEVVARAGRELEAVQYRLEQLAVRPLAVYEHPPLLRRALKHARDRILLISPWIRRAVVTREFVETLGEALKRGVNVYIGYGLGESDVKEKPWDKEARSELARLAEGRGRFTFKRLGDTHAKVLIKDQEFFVITSFNWLSFRGNQNQTFREEWGTLVAVPSVVEEYFQQMVGRFVANEGSG